MYQLTAADREIIRRTAGTATGNLSILADIHLRKINDGERRHARLSRELEACERTLAMRRLALDLLADVAEARLRQTLSGGSS